MHPTHGSFKWGVAEGEDPSVGGNQPVAVSIRSDRYSHHWGIEVHPTHGSFKWGVAEGKDPSVGGNQPVATAVGCGRHSDNWRVEMQRRQAAKRRRSISATEHCSVGARCPIARSAVRRRNTGPETRCTVERGARWVWPRLTIWEREFVGVQQPIPIAFGDCRQCAASKSSGQRARRLGIETAGSGGSGMERSGSVERGVESKDPSVSTGQPIARCGPSRCGVCGCGACQQHRNAGAGQQSHCSADGRQFNLLDVPCSKHTQPCAAATLPHRAVQSSAPLIL